MTTKTLMHTPENKPSQVERKMSSDTMEHLPLLLLPLPSNFAFDTVQEQLESLWHEHHAGHVLRGEQLEEGFRYERTSIDNASPGVQYRNLNRCLEHMRQGKDRQSPVLGFNV